MVGDASSSVLPVSLHRIELLMYRAVSQQSIELGIDRPGFL
jgi:hypothetical protein